MKREQGGHKVYNKKDRRHHRRVHFYNPSQFVQHISCVKKFLGIQMHIFFIPFCHGGGWAVVVLFIFYYF